jgi:hypothetical protein
MPNLDPWIPRDRGAQPDGTPAYTATLSEPARPVWVYRYNSTGTTRSQQFYWLDNVECVQISFHEGADPGTASFNYILGNGDSAAPQTFEQALDLSIQKPKSILAGDRLVVLAMRPDGRTESLFDGRALAFGVNLSGNSEGCYVRAIGIAKELWNTPIGGQMLRDSHDLAGGKDLQTDLPARFNPVLLPASATPQDTDHDDGVGNTYPVFADPQPLGKNTRARKWTLPMAAKYLLGTGNPGQLNVTNPTAKYLDDTLVATYWTTPDITQIMCPDQVITGRDMPNVLYDLIRDAGFSLCFRPRLDNSGASKTLLSIYRQQQGPLQDLWLQPRGTTLDLTYTNLGDAGIERDLTEVVNRWIVEGALYRYESSFVLAPGYPATAADAANTASLDTFQHDAVGFDGVRDKYRTYLFDETGQGHYTVGTDAKLTTVGNLAPVLNQNGLTPFVNRLRKPFNEVMVADATGKLLPASLSISTDYAGAKPGVWDGTGTWQPVAGGWGLLKDRVGIWINNLNPNSWSIGAASNTPSVMPFPDGKVNGVEYQQAANPKNFHLRLTCVIEGDQAVKGIADTQYSSILPTEIITRRVEARERFSKWTQSKTSVNNTTGADSQTKDDTDVAIDEAKVFRAQTEQGQLNGTVTIPRLTTFYEMGTRIRGINGRNLGFRTDGNTGDAQALYPVVIGYSFDLDGQQRTTLILSDAGAQPKRLETRLHRTRNDGGG